MAPLIQSAIWCVSACSTKAVELSALFVREGARAAAECEQPDRGSRLPGGSAARMTIGRPLVAWLPPEELRDRRRAAIELVQPGGVTGLGQQLELGVRDQPHHSTGDLRPAERIAPAPDEARRCPDGS